MKSVSFPLELAEVEPWAEASLKGDKGSREVDRVEVTTLATKLRVPDEPRAVGSPEGREVPRTPTGELVNFIGEATNDLSWSLA